MRSRLAICLLAFLLIVPSLFAQQPGMVTTTARRLANDVDLTVGATTGGKNVYVYATEGSELAPALTAGNWTVGSGWESPIVGPGLIKNADGTGTQTPSAATTIVAGTTYKVVITLSALSVGSASYTLGGVTGTSLAAATTYTDYITASTTGKLIITPTNTSRFTISAISYKALTDATGDSTVYGNLKLASPIQNINGTNALTISPLGRVGIGTTAPNAALQVSGTTRWLSIDPDYASSLLTLRTSDTLYVRGSDSSYHQYFAASVLASGWLRAGYNVTGGLIDTADTNEDLTIDPNGSGRIILQGNVGAGTTAPDKQVEINSTTGANLRLTYDDADGSAANYTDFATTSGGNLTVTPSGGTFTHSAETLGSEVTTQTCVGWTYTIASPGWTDCTGTTLTRTASASNLTATSAAVTSGTTYKVVWTLTRSAGTFTMSVGGVSGAARSASGTYTEIITATATTAITLTVNSSAAGSVDLTAVSVKAITVPSILDVTASGSASSPALRLTGFPNIGGTSTTTKPLLLIEPSGTTSNTWSTNGALFGINAPIGFAGNLMDIQSNTTSRFYVTSAGNWYLSGSGFLGLSSVLSWFGNSASTIGLTDGYGASLPYSTLRVVNGAGTNTINDAQTAASGTVADRYLFGQAAPTLTATNSSVTYTTASTWYIGGAPTASTNVTIGTAYALNVAAGNTNLGGTGLTLGGIPYTVPVDDGDAGEQLQSNGSGVLSWESAASKREYKNVLGEHTNASAALQLMLNLPVYDFTYKPTHGTGDLKTIYTGVMAEDAPWAMHHNGGILNPINTFGYTVLAIQALNAKIEQLEQQVRELQASKEKQ